MENIQYTEMEEKYTQLEMKIKELTLSNKELEQFAYMASHDLQEPLRMISGFLQLFEKKYTDNIDEEGKKYIRFALDGASRMKQLINDMLEYSKAGLTTKETGVTDMNEVMQEVMKIFQHEIDTQQAIIKTAMLPLLPNTSKNQMIQLMLNLVGNALKYHGDKKPEVEVKVRKKEGEWLFCVKDNGIGIDPASAEKIFVLFHRLHSKKDYPGTGIGLAIVKKIVERYGGNIWVESDPGQGSAFYFTFPQQDLA